MGEPERVPTVRIEPIGIVVDVLEGESIMTAANRTGYYWPTVCGGEGSCHTCYLRVLAGKENLTPEEAYEHEGLEDIRRVVRYPDDVRLACQVRTLGDAVVEKRGVRVAVREPDLAEAESPV